MPGSACFRWLYVLAAVSAAFHTPAFAENWVSQKDWQVDRDSIRREGTWVYYHWRPGPIWPTFEERVDCSQVGASEVVIESWTDGLWSASRLPSNSIGANIARYVCSSI